VKAAEKTLLAILTAPFATAARTVLDWGEFVKISHTVFAMPFALASMAIAARESQGWPGVEVFVWIVLALACARTCAMAFNRLVDRKFDAKNPRTANRHLPSGRISLLSAWTLCIGSAVAFLAVTSQINPVCFALAPIALFVVCFYSLTKRFTDFTHVYLGVALALAPIGAWLAVDGAVRWLPFRESFLIPLLMAAAVVFWLIGFDIIYATQDHEFDKANGLHSLVVRWGVPRALQFAFRMHLAMWGLLVATGVIAGFRLAYILCLGVILVSLVVEHWLARRRSLKWINIAFFRLNALVSLVFLVGVLVEVAFTGPGVFQ
jgi:4-hydroxybenzoate polyprenyltransferase